MAPELIKAEGNYGVTRTIYPLLKLLCFSNWNKSVMDKLCCCLRQSRLRFSKSKGALEDTTLFPNTFVNKALDKGTVLSASESNNNEELGEYEEKEEKEEEEEEG